MGSVHILFPRAVVLYTPVSHYRHNIGAIVLKLRMGVVPKNRGVLYIFIPLEYQVFTCLPQYFKAVHFNSF